MRNSVFICYLVSCQCYVTWLVFGVSFFCLERCLHYVGRWFHQLVYDFHLNVVSFLLHNLPKVILASGEVFMFMKSEVPVRFMLGDFGLHGSCDCVIDEHLIVDIVICFGLLSYWTTHSYGFLFVIITIILTSQPTCSGCHVRCFDNACCSFSLWLWSAPQPPPNSCNPKPWCSLSHASRSY